LPGLRPSLLDNEQVDLISAAVKNRKRKLLTWKKINGVETPVALDEGKTQPPTDTSRKGVEVALPSSKAILSLPLIPVRLPKLKSQGAKVAAGTKKL